MLEMRDAKQTEQEKEQDRDREQERYSVNICGCNAAANPEEKQDANRQGENLHSMHAALVACAAGTYIHVYLHAPAAGRPVIAGERCIRVHLCVCI